MHWLGLCGAGEDEAVGLLLAEQEDELAGSQGCVMLQALPGHGALCGALASGTSSRRIGECGMSGTVLAEVVWADWTGLLAARSACLSTSRSFALYADTSYRTGSIIRHIWAS